MLKDIGEDTVETVIANSEKKIGSSYLVECDSLVFQQQIITESKNMKQFENLLSSLEEASSLCIDLGLSIFPKQKNNNLEYGMALQRLSEEVEKIDGFLDSNPILQQSLSSATKGIKKFGKHNVKIVFFIIFLISGYRYGSFCKLSNKTIFRRRSTEI